MTRRPTESAILMNSTRSFSPSKLNFPSSASWTFHGTYLWDTNDKLGARHNIHKLLDEHEYEKGRTGEKRGEEGIKGKRARGGNEREMWEQRQEEGRRRKIEEGGREEVNEEEKSGERREERREGEWTKRRKKGKRGKRRGERGRGKERSRR